MCVEGYKTSSKGNAVWWEEFGIYIAGVAGALTSLGVIYAIFHKIINAALKGLKTMGTMGDQVAKIPEMADQIEVIDCRTQKTETWVEKQKEDEEFIKKSRLLSYKQAVYNEHLPLEERVEAGEDYVGHDGNGFTKTYLREVLKPLQIEGVKKKNRK